MSTKKLNKINTNTNYIKSFNQTSFSGDNNSSSIQYISEVNDTINFDIDNYNKKSGEISLIEKTEATIESGTLSLLEGLGEFVETISDTVAVACTVVATPVTALYDLGQTLSSDGKINSLTNKMWDYQKDYISQDIIKGSFDELYDNTKLGNNIKEQAYQHDNIRNIGRGVGKVAGIVASAVATQGSSIAVSGATATSSSFSGILSAVGAASGFGEGAQEAWKNGSSVTEGLEYAVANGAWQGTQYLVGAKINTIKVGANGVGNAAVRVGMDAATGAAEGFSRPALDTIYKDEKYKDLFEKSGGLKNVGTQAAIAATMSAVSEISGVAEELRYEKEGTNNNKLSKEISNINEEMFNLQYEDIRKNIGKATLDDLNNLLNYKNIDLDKAGYLNERYFKLTGHNHKTILKLRDKMNYDEIFNGVGPAEFALKNNDPNNLKTKAEYAYRITGLDQIEDIEYSGVVRPKGYGSRYERVGPKVYWSEGGDIQYGDHSRAVIEVSQTKLKNGQMGPVSIDDIDGIWVFDEKDNAYKNIINEVKQNNIMRNAGNIELNNKNILSTFKKYDDIRMNVNNATLEDLDNLLNNYNKDINIDGVIIHDYIDPLNAASLNARYKELTGHDHPVFLQEQEKVLDQYIKSGDGIRINGQPTIYERLKNNITGKGQGIEVLSSRKGSYIDKLDNIKYNMSKASLEDVTDILNHYGQDSALINGIVNHKKITPLEGASLNARYKELTGHDHPVFLQEQEKVLDQYIKSGDRIRINGQPTVYEQLKNNTLEIGNKDHIVNRTSEIIMHPEQASLSDISSLLDYYDGNPVIIDGVAHHPFNDPSSAAKLNARYKELTGHDHQNYIIKSK